MKAINDSYIDLICSFVRKWQSLSSKEERDEEENFVPLIFLLI